MPEDRRKEKRHDVRLYNCVSIECRRPEECPGCKVVGLCSDASDSGMCVYSIAPLKTGTRVIVACKFNGTSIKDATVKWCVEVNKDLHKLGLAVDRQTRCEPERERGDSLRQRARYQACP
jgi:hypothetical protein